MTIRVRFAPSPTGHLHVGNVRTALFNWLYARGQDGRVALRIEDTDIERSTKESEEIIYEDLRWLGLDWDEGPDIGGDYGPYRQSERLNIYKKYTSQLIDEGKAYYCFCSPGELEAERKRAAEEGRPPKYSRQCYGLNEEEAKRKIKAGEPASIRLYVQEGEEVIWDDLVKGKTVIATEVVGDQIIMRASGMPRYNWAVVVDDHLMEISHVVRGDDHVPNTPIQILLYRALGWKVPKFAHLSMIAGQDHARLSKRHGATSVFQFREAGYLPEAMINYLALLGWSPGDEEKMTLDSLIKKFSLKKVSSSAAIFDMQKLNWLNSRYIHEKRDRELVDLILPYLKEANLLPEKIDDNLMRWLEILASTLKTGLVTLKDIVREADAVFDFRIPLKADGAEESLLMEEEGTDRLLKLLLEEAEANPPETAEKYREMMLAVMNKTDRKGRSLFHPIRVAITGRLSGPELENLIPLIESGSRLELPRPIIPVAERIRRFIKSFYR